MYVLLPRHSSVTIQSFIKVAVHIFLTITTEVVPSAQLMYMSHFNMNTHTTPTQTHTFTPTCSHISMLLFSTIYPNQTLWRCLSLVQISPDSRSSELERRSLSYDRDLSRSLPRAVSGEVDLSLSSHSAFSTLLSRHASPAPSLPLSWDKVFSLSRV